MNPATRMKINPGGVSGDMSGGVSEGGSGGGSGGYPGGDPRGGSGGGIRGGIRGGDAGRVPGQVFTPPEIVRRMAALRRNRGRVLEPSSGAGAFLRAFPEAAAIEKDPLLAAATGATAGDFFDYPATERFATVIGNPPYVRHRDIPADTRAKLDMTLFDRRANLYLFFMEKALRHLEPGGELIFITPREFRQATAARKLNAALFAAGTITHYEELGDAKVFADAAPNCAIWRFEKGNPTRRLADGRAFRCVGGQLCFGDIGAATVGEYFSVKVGAVSGADHVFADPRRGNRDFVCSETVRDGRTRRMIYEAYHPVLEARKAELLRRAVRRFNESNWWRWGRRYPDSGRPRIYVNAKTRNPRPFFLHEAAAFDGAVLALFPRDPDADLARWTRRLNDADWEGLGFVCDGRRLFSQRALENAAAF